MGRLNLWDSDTVEPHNINNQVFLDRHIGIAKVDAIEDILKEINPNIEIIKHNKKCTTKNKLKGYVFMCIDNIDVRRELCTAWKYNPDLIFLVDGRMSVTGAHVYAAEWSNKDERQTLLDSMQYTHEEVVAQTPVSACGMTISVVAAPRSCAGLMVTNTLRYINTKSYYRCIMTDTYNMYLDAYEVK